MKRQLPQTPNMYGWFIPEREDFPSQRALLHLGLNRASRYYRELIVPGIGGVWFVRQLSWAIAGIILANESKHRPAKIANAIEALACKLQWNREQDNYAGKGKRAFERDREEDLWSFKDLSNEKHYVQVTYRQSSVRALTGLGLTIGTRFNSMELTGLGVDLTDAFFNQNKGIKGKRSVQVALIQWIKEEAKFNVKNISDGLVRTDSTEMEKKIVHDLLRSDSIDNLSNSQRRTRLIDAFGKNTKRPPDFGILKKILMKQNEEQWNNIDTAKAFDNVLKNSQYVIHICAELIAEDSLLKISELSENNQLKDVLGEVKKCAKFFYETQGEKHKDAIEFVSEILKDSISDNELLKRIVKRDGNILRYSNEKIIKGPLFDHHKEIMDDTAFSQEQVGSEESSTENKIRQLFNLWRDCQ